MSRRRAKQVDPQKVFEQKLAAHQRKFEAAQGDPDDECEAQNVLDFVLEYERLRRGVSAGTPEAVEVDRQTIEKIRAWDTDDPSLTTAEKVLKRLTSDRAQHGLSLLRSAVEAERNIASQVLRAVAREPRSAAFDMLIAQLFDADPSMSNKQLLHQLEQQHTPGKVIKAKTNEAFILAGGRSVKFSSIPSKVSALRSRGIVPPRK